ncbi:unnamed protein product [Urochloa humidicola]
MGPQIEAEQGRPTSCGRRREAEVGAGRQRKAEVGWVDGARQRKSTPNRNSRWGATTGGCNGHGRTLGGAARLSGDERREAQRGGWRRAAGAGEESGAGRGGDKEENGK